MRKGKTRTAQLPKHLTSDEFFQHCEDKKKKKEDEEREKAMKKQIREENSRKRQKEKEERVLIRKRKQEEKQRMQEEKQKNSKGKGRLRKTNNNGTRTSIHPATSASTGEGPSSDAGPSEPAPKRQKVLNQDKCGLCGTDYTSDSEKDWIECNNCGRWYEETCAGVKASDLEDEDWFCHICESI